MSDQDSNYIPINAWHEDDRPREKLLNKGRASLSNAELLAIVLGSGSRNESAVALSQRILSNANHSLNILGKLTIKQLMEYKGIGKAKAIGIAAVMELGRRRRAELPEVLDKVTSSKMVFEVMQPIIGEINHEEFWILFLNTKNQITSKSPLSTGGMTSTIVDSRLLFKIALEKNAAAIIIVHNHPSGDPAPSQQDKDLTKRLFDAGRLLQLPILDHVIVGERAYFSFADSTNILQ